MPGALHKQSMLAATGIERKRRTAHCPCDLCTLPLYRRAQWRRMSAFCQAPLRFYVGLDGYLKEDIILAPQKRYPRQPILCSNSVAGMLPIFLRQNARPGGELRTGNLPPNGGRRNLDIWIVSNALEFSGVAASHHVEFFTFLREPYRCVNRSAIFPEGGQTDVVLTVDFGWNCLRHIPIVNRSPADAPLVLIACFVVALLP